MRMSDRLSEKGGMKSAAWLTWLTNQLTMVGGNDLCAGQGAGHGGASGRAVHDARIDVSDAFDSRFW